VPSLPDRRMGGVGRTCSCALSSLSVPGITILRASSGSGRCSALASSQGARNQTSFSSPVVRHRHGLRVYRRRWDAAASFVVI